jgi:hypothetical protein
MIISDTLMQRLTEVTAPVEVLTLVRQRISAL